VRARNTTVKPSTLSPTLSATMHSVRQTDRQTRSSCQYHEPIILSAVYDRPITLSLTLQIRKIRKTRKPKDWRDAAQDVHVTPGYGP